MVSVTERSNARPLRPVKGTIIWSKGPRESETIADAVKGAGHNERNHCSALAIHFKVSIQEAGNWPIAKYMAYTRRTRREHGLHENKR